MEIPSVYVGPVGAAALFQTEKAGNMEENPLFQSLLDDLQIKAELLEHMQGVPSDAVYIAPNMLQKMKEDPAVYDFYMEQLDYFVGEYKRCNLPGVMEMSFFIRSDGQYGIRAENILLKRQCEAAGGGEDVPGEREEWALSALWDGRPTVEAGDTSLLSLCLAGAYALHRERIKSLNV